MLGDLVATNMRPKTLFEEDGDKRARLMGALDEINSRYGKRTYMSTASRITSGDELNRRNGLGGSALDFRLIRHRYQLLLVACHVGLTEPAATSDPRLPRSTIATLPVTRAR
jgi:hypothetical protein